MLKIRRETSLIFKLWISLHSDLDFPIQAQCFEPKNEVNYHFLSGHWQFLFWSAFKYDFSFFLRRRTFDLKKDGQQRYASPSSKEALHRHSDIGKRSGTKIRDKRKFKGYFFQSSLKSKGTKSFFPEVLLKSAEISRILFFSRSPGNFASLMSSSYWYCWRIIPMHSYEILWFGSDHCPTISMAMVSPNIFKLSVNKQFLSFSFRVIFGIGGVQLVINDESAFLWWHFFKNCRHVFLQG